MYRRSFLVGSATVAAGIVSPARAASESLAANSAPSTIIDLTPAFLRVFSLPIGMRLRAFRDTVYAPLRPFFTNITGVDNISDQQIADMLRRSEPLIPEMRMVVHRAPQQFERARTVFARAFADFNAEAAMYLVPSFFCIDGATRIVNGRPAFLLGVDRIAARPSDASDVLFTHELFHVHHYHAAPDAIGDTVWQRLWDEGLATHVSMELAPEPRLGAALGDPALERRALPLRREIVQTLRGCVDDTSQRCVRRFFTAGSQDDMAFPARSGYYIGTLAARRIAAGRSLTEIAHMRAPEAREAIVETLDALAAEAA